MPSSVRQPSGSGDGELSDPEQRDHPLCCRVDTAAESVELMEGDEVTCGRYNFLIITAAIHHGQHLTLLPGGA